MVNWSPKLQTAVSDLVRKLWLVSSFYIQLASLLFFSYMFNIFLRKWSTQKNQVLFTTLSTVLLVVQGILIIKDNC